MIKQNTDNSNIRMAGIIAFCFMFIYLLISIFFWKERMTFLDGPFILFNIINEQKLMIMESRLGSFITQIIPYMGLKIGLDLPELLWAYNFSFGLFYFLVSVIVVLIWRQYKIGIAIAFYYILLSGESFYWTNNEIHQAIGWMFLALGFWEYKKYSFANVIDWLIFVVLGVLAVTTHPLMILVTPGIIGFYRLSGLFNKSARNGNQIIILLIVLLVATRLGLSIITGWYDRAKLITIVEGSNIQNISTDLINDSLNWILVNPAGLVVLIAGIIGLISQKKYRTIGLILLWTVGYIVAFFIMFLEFIPFYSISELMPVMVIWSLPFVHFFLPDLRDWTRLSIVTVLLLVGIGTLFLAHRSFTDRYELLGSMVMKLKTEQVSKGIFLSNPELDQIFKMNWGGPVESIMWSSINDLDILYTFKIVDSSTVGDLLRTPQSHFVDCFKTIPITKLNDQYFPIETLTSYQLIK